MAYTQRLFPDYFVYRRGDGWVHMVNASSEKSALSMLNLEPHTYTIIAHCTSLVEGHERIKDERDRHLHTDPHLQ